MDTLIYTRDDQEYEMLSGIFGEESLGVIVTRGLLDGHYHVEREYDIVVVSINGAEGMKLVCKYRELYGNTLVIWITDDSYFAGVVIRLHIFDFIVHPLEGERFRESLKKIKDGDIEVWQRGAVKNSIYQSCCICGTNIREKVSGRRKFPLKARRNRTIWTKIRDYFLSESTL